jgi:hypothetical protein
MNIFDRSFLITIGITAVICGAIFYYVNTRTRELEMALARQNQVLSAFISNVQQEFRARASSGAGAGPGAGARESGARESGARESGAGGTTELASPEALKAVAELKHTHETKKIVISDSDSDSDDDSDSDESVSDEDDSITDDEGVSRLTNIETVEDNNRLVVYDDVSSIKIVEISDSLEELNDNANNDDDEQEDDDSDDSDDESDDEVESVKQIHVERENYKDLELIDLDLDVEQVQAEEVQAEQALTESNSDNEIVHLEDVSVSIHDKQAENTSEEVNINSSNINSSNINYNDLKVDELRKIVIDKGLANKEEARKLKKPELLAVLVGKV